jgi:hypothetical protein
MVSPQLIKQLCNTVETLEKRRGASSFVVYVPTSEATSRELKKRVSQNHIRVPRKITDAQEWVAKYAPPDAAHG